MLRKSLTALSAALMLTTSMAQARNADQFDAKTKAAATAVYTTEQNTWWKEYVESGKTAAKHIEDISSEKPQAAMWFLLTGGKYGFVNRKATEEEAGQMFKAMRNIALHFGNAANKGQGLEAWKDVAQHRAGQAHLDMIYGQIDALEDANRLLNAKVDRVEHDLATEKREREREVGGLRGQIGTLNDELKEVKAECKSLREQLAAEREERLTEANERRAAEAALHGRIAAIQEDNATKVQEMTDKMLEFQTSMQRQMMGLMETSEKRNEGFERSLQGFQTTLMSMQQSFMTMLIQAQTAAQEAQKSAEASKKEAEAHIEAKAEAEIARLTAGHTALTETLRADKREESQKVFRLIEIAAPKGRSSE